MSEPPALAVRHVSKSFGGVVALDDVELAVRRGEVHALLGENGSGKSTLIKVLAARHEPAAGAELEIDGRRVSMPLRPGQPRALGMSFVHQDLALVPSLTVADNMRLEELASSNSLRISPARERERAEKDLARFGLELDPRRTVAELSPTERAQLAIARAAGSLARPGYGLLILDEPTAFLPESEKRALFGLITGVARSGSAVLLVSHDVAEARAVSDRITVLRDGCNVGTVASAGIEVEALVEMIVGHGPRAGGAPETERERPDGQISIAGLSGDHVREVSIDVQRGEVVGLTGLPGSGFDEVPYLLFGARPCRAGTLALDRVHDLTKLTPARALRAGIVLVPADRRRDGGVGSLSLTDNVSLPLLDRYRASGGLRLDRRRMRAATAAVLATHDVRPADPELAYEALSGGNQQRALLAKWLQIQPRLLLLHEPTRGVDVGAREQILTTLRRVAKEGSAVLCASADRGELRALCDRVIVFAGGRAGS